MTEAAAGSLSQWLVQRADRHHLGESESSPPVALQQWAVPLAALTVTASPVSAYQDEDIAWLWPGRIPSGMLTIIEGDPGQGKSTVTLDLAARLSTGRAMPGEHGQSDPQTVLLLSAENSVTVTIRRRLRAAGADLTRVHVLDETTTADGRERLIELPGDLPAIEQTIHRLGATLVVIDPLTAFLTDKTNSNSDHGVRRALWPVHRMAQRTGAAVVVVRHLTKAGGSKAIYRGGGSIGLAAAARAVYLIAADPDDEHRKLFARVKLNIATPPPTLAYRLPEDPEHQCARVAWSAEPVTLTAADLLAGLPAPPGRPALARAAAEDLLRRVLADGPVPVSQIKSAALAAGISWRTVETAKTNLHVISQRDRDERGHLRPPTWWLPTPPHRTNSSPPTSCRVAQQPAATHETAGQSTDTPAAHTARTHPANRLGGPRSGSAPLFEQVPQSFQHRPDGDLPVPVSPNSTAGGGPRDNALLLADDAGDGDQR